jgi:hypothetical protein
MLLPSAPVAARPGAEMTDSPNKSGQPTDRTHASASAHERRRHHHLRDLVDEMMASIRAAANHDIFSADDRAEAESQLERIMARVHAEAMSVADGARRRNGVTPRAD